MKRQIPADEPPPLPRTQSSSSASSASHSRGPTAPPKSPAPFTLPSTLRCRACCTHACCARRYRMPSCAIDVSVAARHPGVRAVLTIAVQRSGGINLALYRRARRRRCGGFIGPLKRRCTSFASTMKRCRLLPTWRRRANSCAPWFTISETAPPGTHRDFRRRPNCRSMATCAAHLARASR